jgi:hypothetical protein
MTRPDLTTLPDFHKRYVDHVKDLDVIDALKNANEQMLQLVRSIPEERGLFKYAPEKWTIKESLCHILDTERILAYRAMRFARNDKTPLPGFEENDYAPEANANNRNLIRIADEMERLRLTTIDLFEDFTPQMLSRKGLANNLELSVLNLGYIIAGHECHHLKILKERYLI